MDPNANPNPVPVNPVPAAPIATPGEPGQPDHTAEVSALKAWFINNAVSLIVTAVVIALVCYYLDPIDTLKVVIGLGLVIFIHELGHFVAAKWCDVHVKTFSIGFGPSVPFCSYKWGETTYMVGIIPLGGYVSMVGEGDNAGDEEGEEDPRSFRRKSVGQRMLIISAGVVMNVILGMGCFVAAYLHGVREEPATVGAVVSGGAAWRAGIKVDDKILAIDSRERPTFNELRPIVMSTRKGESVTLIINRGGKKLDPMEVEPLREEGTLFPTLGINAEARLTLLSFKKKSIPPTQPGSVAARANPPFERGDRIVGMTDPKKPDTVTPLRPDPTEPGNGPEIEDYYARMAALADRPIVFQVLRQSDAANAKPTDITIPPAYRSELGMRMRVGDVVALRRDGPAEKAKVIARVEGPNATPGDRIKSVKLPEPDGRETWFTNDPGEAPKNLANVTVHKLDPILLPRQITKWARQWADRNAANPKATTPDLKLKLIVMRTVGHKENTPIELTLDYDFTYQDDREVVLLPNSPVPLAGLGLAYWAEAVVEEVAPNSPASEKGVQAGDVVTSVRFKSLDADGQVKTSDWEDVKVQQWAFVEASFQDTPPYRIDLKVLRNNETVEILDLEGAKTRTGRPTIAASSSCSITARSRPATSATPLTWAPAAPCASSK